MKILFEQVELSPNLHRLLKITSNLLIVIFGILMVLIILGSSNMKYDSISQDDFLLQYGIMFNLLMYLFILILAVNNFSNWESKTGKLLLGISITTLVLSFAELYQSKIVSINQNGGLSVGITALIIGVALLFIGKRNDSNNYEFVNTDDSANRFIGKRLLAIIIDYFVFMFAIGIVLLLFGESIPSNNPMVLESKQGSGLALFIIFWFWILYFPGLEALMGQTFGKIIAGIQVVRINQYYHPFRVSLIRHTFDIIELVSFGLISVGIMMASKSNRRLGDILAGSKVVKI